MDAGAMSTNRVYLRPSRRGGLSGEQEFSLLYGHEDRWADAFADDEERREAWIRHRERLLERYQHGRRPMAWWDYEASIPFPGYERQQARLFEAGLLSEPEAQELLAWWREQFDHAWSPHFFHCDGPGRIYEGPIGRQKHFAWAGIPRALLKQWKAERRRRSRTIRKIETAASEPEPAA
jgi:hypothetical protein